MIITALCIAVFIMAIVICILSSMILAMTRSYKIMQERIYGNDD